jgi:8-oxo-dGTP diphosphatase
MAGCPACGGRGIRLDLDEPCSCVSDKHPRPIVSLTADVVLLSNDGVLLVKRAKDPFKDYWALPGGFLNHDERAVAAARRELKEETGISIGPLKFLMHADAPKRDPRGRVISFVFFAATVWHLRPQAGDDAAEVGFFDLDDLPPMAFDHEEILAVARTHVADSGIVF